MPGLVLRYIASKISDSWFSHCVISFFWVDLLASFSWIKYGANDGMSLLRLDYKKTVVYVLDVLFLFLGLLSQGKATCHTVEGSYEKKLKEASGQQSSGKWGSQSISLEEQKPTWVHLKANLSPVGFSNDTSDPAKSLAETSWENVGQRHSENLGPDSWLTETVR